VCFFLPLNWHFLHSVVRFLPLNWHFYKASFDADFMSSSHFPHCNLFGEISLPIWAKGVPVDALAIRISVAGCWLQPIYWLCLADYILESPTHLWLWLALKDDN
jgi:hypothetical protein